jgi:hypothetical protein
MMLNLCLCCALVAATALAADPPSAQISSGGVRAKLYLPDAENGYYRATRFDWAGQIASLEYQGHNYFGQWFERYDPKLHDSILGPVESFNAIGYDDAPVGGTFLRIGVGYLRKPQENRLSDFKTYEITDSGKWSVKTGPDWVEMTHELADTYVYRKTVRVAKGQLVLEHSLRNTGKKTLDTNVFNHDFYMLDNQPTGPDVVVSVPFDLGHGDDWRGPGETRGKELRYLQELEKGQTVSATLTGYGDGPSDYDIRVENRKTGAKVRQTSDRPMSRLYFWSIRTTVCPEAYIHLHVEPGNTDTWRITYEFQ